MSDQGKQKNQANARAGLLLERSVELRRFRQAYPNSEARFKEIAAHAPDDVSETVSHVLALFAPRPDTANIPEVAQFFGLSAAESRLAAWLMSGGKLADYAREAGVSRNTARNQLQSIFQKVQVNRQAELVTVLMETASRL